MFLRTLFCILFTIGLFQLLKAQPRFLVGAGVSVEQPSFGNGDDDSPVFVHPLIEPGWSIEFSNSEIVLFWNFSYQQLDAGPAYLNSSSETGQQQRFAIQNLRTGPGIRYLPWKNRRLRPMLSLGFVVGTPLRFEYEFFNFGDDLRLPQYGKVAGGANIGTGWNVLLGLELKLNDHWRCTLSAGQTNYSQLFGRVGNSVPEWDAGYIFSGAANLAQLGMIYRH